MAMLCVVSMAPLLNFEPINGQASPKRPNQASLAYKTCSAPWCSICFQMITFLIVYILERTAAEAAVWFYDLICNS